MGENKVAMYRRDFFHDISYVLIEEQKSTKKEQLHTKDVSDKERLISMRYGKYLWGKWTIHYIANRCKQMLFLAVLGGADLSILNVCTDMFTGKIFCLLVCVHVCFCVPACVYLSLHVYPLVCAYAWTLILFSFVSVCMRSYRVHGCSAIWNSVKSSSVKGPLQLDWAVGSFCLDPLLSS